MLRYLALGDSYTVGEGVPAQACWPMQLVEKLRRHGIAVDAPQIIAVTGWTTDELSGGMDRAALSPGYDLVSLLIGVNNQYRGRSLDEYREQFRSLLLRAVALAGHRQERVVVISIPDWSVTPFGHASGRDRDQIARELDTFNATARDIAEGMGVLFVNITGISRDHAALVAADGLHPSASQYALWADAIEPAVLKAIKQP